MAVIAVYGLPGAGKSSLIRLLAPALALPVIDRDAIRAAMFPGGEHGAAHKAAANEAVFAALRLHAAAGRGSLIDGMSFADAAQRAYAAGIAAAFALPYRPLWLDCPVAVAIARIKAQPSHPARDRGTALVQQVARRFAAVDAAVPRLDATAPLPELLAAALRLTQASACAR